MADDVLPMPDWDNPAPYGGWPQPEDTAALAALERTAQTIRAWAAVAYIEHPGKEHWTQLGDMLAQVSQMCTDRAVAVDKEQPHGA